MNDYQSVMNRIALRASPDALVISLSNVYSGASAAYGDPTISPRDRADAVEHFLKIIFPEDINV